MKRYITLSIGQFYGFSDRDNLETLQDVADYVSEWQFSSGYQPGYEIKLSDCYYDIEEAYSYLVTTTGLTRADLNRYSEEIEDAFRRAMNDAYYSSYESEWLGAWYGELREKVNEALAEFGTIYLVKNHKRIQPMPNNWSDCFMDTDLSTVQVQATRSQLLKYLGEEDNGQLWDELADSVIDTIGYNVSEVNIELIDYHGLMGDSDSWLECFKDYEEITATIKNDIKKHGPKVKAYIANNVPLLARTASLA